MICVVVVTSMLVAGLSQRLLCTDSQKTKTSSQKRGAIRAHRNTLSGLELHGYLPPSVGYQSDPIVEETHQSFENTRRTTKRKTVQSTLADQALVSVAASSAVAI